MCKQQCPARSLSACAGYCQVILDLFMQPNLLKYIDEVDDADNLAFLGDEAGEDTEGEVMAYTELRQELEEATSENERLVAVRSPASSPYAPS